MLVISTYRRFGDIPPVLGMSGDKLGGFGDIKKGLF